MHNFHTGYTVDGWGALVLNVSLVVIVLGYAVIAYQFWHARHPSRLQQIEVPQSQLSSCARRGFLQLLLIFLFGAASGFTPRLIHYPIDLFVFVHFALAFATWWYILSRQAVIIAVAMSAHVKN